MPEIQYKFKSSLSFEIIKFSEPTITVGVLKELINQKQSIKTCGFDMKLKDSHGKVYTDDDDMIDLKSKIIVSRVPKIAKTQLNVKKKENTAVNNNLTGISNEVPDEVNNSEKEIHTSNEKSQIEPVPVDPVPEKHDQPILDILKCSLCHNLMKDSMQIKCCKTNYCHECITGYLFDPDISGSLECPNCKAVVSSKDVNLTDNMKIRSMVYDFQNGKLDSGTTIELVEETIVDDGFSMNLENVHEVEIALPTSNNSSPVGDQTTAPFLENVDTVQPFTLPSPSVDKSNESNSCVSETKPAQIESIIHSTAVPSDLVVENQKNQNIRVNDINPIEQHYQGHSYTSQVPVDQKYSNHVEIPVINTSTEPDVKNNSNFKDSSNLSIHDLDFDPVMYMKFLKIVGENCPDELRKILSNNNDSLHITKESRKSSGAANKRMKENEYHDKHTSKKSRYEMETDDSKHKKAYNPVDKHSDNRYYENIDKKSGRARSRSKEHYQKKADGYPSSRRTRDYEARDRDYYPNNGPRYRSTEGQNYQDDRHKYRSNYSSLNRIKSKRPMDR